MCFRVPEAVEIHWLVQILSPELYKATAGCHHTTCPLGEEVGNVAFSPHSKEKICKGSLQRTLKCIACHWDPKRIDAWFIPQKDKADCGLWPDSSPQNKRVRKEATVLMARPEMHSSTDPSAACVHCNGVGGRKWWETHVSCGPCRRASSLVEHRIRSFKIRKHLSRPKGLWKRRAAKTLQSPCKMPWTEPTWKPLQAEEAEDTSLVRAVLLFTSSSSYLTHPSSPIKPQLASGEKVSLKRWKG